MPRPNTSSFRDAAKGQPNDEPSYGLGIRGTVLPKGAPFRFGEAQK